MADLTNVINEMTQAKTVLDSAVVYVGTVPGLIAAAVTAAIANGATAEQLKPVSDLGDQLKASSDALTAAIAANTPSPAPTPVQLNKAKGK